MEEGCRRAVYERRRRGTAGSWTRLSGGRPCWHELLGGSHDRGTDFGAHVTGTTKGSGTREARSGHPGFHSLAHLIDQTALRRAFHRQRGSAAAGVDGVTKADYEQELETHLQDLHGRLRARRYRHQPIRRVHIPKEGPCGDRRDRSASPASRTSLCRGRYERCWRQCTSPCFGTARMVFRTRRSGP